MIPVGFFLLLLTVGGETTCSYQDVLNYLNLTKDNELYSMTRPVKDHRQLTVVHLDVLLYAILDVNEIDQKFVPYVWVFMHWKNEHISWNSSEFCDIDQISIPTGILWKPDLMIEEMIEKDKAPPSPHLTISSSGDVTLLDDRVLVCYCWLHVYKFPFDVQSCNLSFKSVIHSIDEIWLDHFSSSSDATDWSREVTRIQNEWMFISITISNKTIEPFDNRQNVLIYTITMKRRSVLYIVNFILPVLFFLCLDFASFLISERGGEKLSFKVTVLLAVTVMQLILNEILPATSNRIPLIALYCIGIFALMLLSLLETIFVMYLLEKDSASQDNETDRDESLSEDCGDKGGKANSHSHEEKKKWNQCLCVCDVSADETPTELLKVSSSELTEVSAGFEKLSDELREVEKTLNLLLNSRKEEGKPGYWARKTTTINKVFFICYVTAAALFLLCMFFIWHNPH
ncbi:5-hydroxytryptamine receptor 3A-like isoform X2 [Trachinotus anak]|uniref:5-hydroxytryptamine receptor 3A-like isoform X2 n=1 Tax=Trachinotus anak TaxID=443729 RepID=UPI0039F250FA